MNMSVRLPKVNKQRRRLYDASQRLNNYPSERQLLFWQRRQWMLSLFVLIITVLLGRAVYLQLIHKDFLQTQGDARHQRILKLPAYRGRLLDRQGSPLAISTPVESVWVNPKQFIEALPQWETLAVLLELSFTELNALLAKRLQREFVYLKRHVSPSVAKQVRDLNLPGVFLQQEYRRYYPAAEITAHFIGFTNIDDQGQEGLELALDKFLTGRPGSKKVVQDKERHIIAEVEALKAPKSGQDIRLSIDLRLQYIAYRELKAAVQTAHAQAGSVVIMDVHTGEVLAMANQPAYNPNNRQDRNSDHYRNRVITDVFEPGSTLKPFTIAAALESGQYTPASQVDTRPGRLQVGEYTIRDSRNYGLIDLGTIIQRSSNVGASKIALSLAPKQLGYILQAVGFGKETRSGFPGEVAGYLPHFTKWHPTEQATLSFGYGLNVTVLQLARAYAVLGNEGVLPPVKLLPVQRETKQDVRVMSVESAQKVLTMLEAVVKKGGTGSRASVLGYRVAGKTGTARKVVDKEYSDNEHIALFAGIAPVEKPRLAMVVLIDEPQGKNYYGGKVAAPVFAKIMAEALRLLNIVPDTTAF
jgi:cell division protein FtsI (penicillin-binding protein 3)